VLCASVIGCTHTVLQANPGSRLASAFTEIVAYVHRSAARVLPDSIDPDERGGATCMRPRKRKSSQGAELASRNALRRNQLAPFHRCIPAKQGKRRATDCRDDHRVKATNWIGNWFLWRPVDHDQPVG